MPFIGIFFSVTFNAIKYRQALGVVPWDSENGHDVLTMYIF